MSNIFVLPVIHQSPKCHCKAEMKNSAHVIAFPAVLSHRGWLKREALRIAADVRGASLFNVRRVLQKRYASSGLTDIAVEIEIEHALEFVEAAVQEMARVGRGSRPTHSDDGDAA